MLLGIDFGTKNIGLAVSDATGSIAFPLYTIKNDGNIFVNINKIILDRNTIKIIIGYPQKQRNIITKNTQNVIGFVKDLRLYTDIECILFDEDFSTQTAKSMIRHYDLHKSSKDTISASLILQWYIDSFKNPLQNQ